MGDFFACLGLLFGLLALQVAAIGTTYGMTLLLERLDGEGKGDE